MYLVIGRSILKSALEQNLHRYLCQFVLC